MLYLLLSIQSLFKAQMGYLLFSRALLRFSSSFRIDFALVKTVLAICIKLLKLAGCVLPPG